MQGQSKEQEGKPTVFSYSGKRTEAAKKRRISLVSVCLISCLFWLAGSYVCMGITKDYVIVPWVLCLFPVVYCWLGMIRLYRCREEMTEEDCRKGPGRLWRSSVMLALFSGISTVGSVGFLLTGNYTSFSLEIGLVVRMGLLCAVSVVNIFLQKKYLSQLEEINNL